MAEAVTVIKGLFGPEPFTFHGRFYDIEALDGQPKPVQQPHPPFLVGGTREHVLRLAARRPRRRDGPASEPRADRRCLSGAHGRARRLDPRRSRRTLDRLELSVLRLSADHDHHEPLRAAADVARAYGTRHRSRHSSAWTCSARPIRWSVGSRAGRQAPRGRASAGASTRTCWAGSTSPRSATSRRWWSSWPMRRGPRCRVAPTTLDRLESERPLLPTVVKESRRRRPRGLTTRR